MSFEIVRTRHNPLVDPSLHVWSWQIPAYLFLGGFVAGIMVLSGWALWQGRRNQRAYATFSLASRAKGTSRPLRCSASFSASRVRSTPCANRLPRRA